MGSFKGAFEYKTLPSHKEYVSLYSSVLQQEYGLDQPTASHLVTTYGKKAFEVLAIAKENPEFQHKLIDSPHFQTIKAEIIY